VRRRELRWVSPTVILVIINVGIYVLTSLAGNSFFETAESVLVTYGQQADAVLNRGQWWQLATSMFVHVDVVHLISNMFFLLIFGLRSEDLFTDRQYVLIYLLSGLAGNLASLLLPLFTISAGASGAIFGVFGAVLICLWRLVGRSARGALLFAFIFLLFSVSAGTNVLAHFGGLAAGLLMCYGLASRRLRLIREMSV
jgi:rhomboid protease GluP